MNAKSAFNAKMLALNAGGLWSEKLAKFRIWRKYQRAPFMDAGM